MNFSKRLYFQYVLSFVLQNLPSPTLYFQSVLSFVPSVILARLADIESW
jgi:hypothetical protein